MLKWSGAKSPSRVLDVGCGIGGTTRILAKNFPDAKTQGIHASLGTAPLRAENACLQTIMVRHRHRAAAAAMPVCIMRGCCITSGQPLFKNSSNNVSSLPGSLQL